MNTINDEDSKMIEVPELNHEELNQATSCEYLLKYQNQGQPNNHRINAPAKDSGFKLTVIQPNEYDGLDEGFEKAKNSFTAYFGQIDKMPQENPENWTTWNGNNPEGKH